MIRYKPGDILVPKDCQTSDTYLKVERLNTDDFPEFFAYCTLYKHNEISMKDLCLTEKYLNRDWRLKARSVTSIQTPEAYKSLFVS